MSLVYEFLQLVEFFLYCHLRAITFALEIIDLLTGHFDVRS